MNVANSRNIRYNLLFESCPHDSRFAHITIANLVMATTMLPPLAAGMIVDVWGVPKLAAGSLILSGVALVWMFRKVREPRQSTKG